MRRRQESHVGPTWVMDTQDQRESALVVDCIAGNRYRTEHHHLVLPTVLCNVKGIREKLEIEKEVEVSRSLITVMQQDAYLQPGEETLALLWRRPAVAEV